jgi:hypothetical protein
MRKVVGIAIAAMAACGDDGGERRDDPDGPVAPDAAIDAASPDAPIDAAIDAPVDGASTLVSEGAFATGLGSLCGIGVDRVSGQIHIFPCMNTSVHVYVEPGTLPDGGRDLHQRRDGCRRALRPARRRRGDARRGLRE